MVMKSKVLSSSSKDFVKGGSGHMSGKNSAGPQVPGQTASLGRSSARFASGGSGHMFGKQTSKPKHPC
jgi:hypothetical protein